MFVEKNKCLLLFSEFIYENLNKMSIVELEPSWVERRTFDVFITFDKLIKYVIQKSQDF